MFCAFDTETSGLMKEGVDRLDPSQPRLLQLGVKLFDHRWNLRGSAILLIKPDGWSIEPQAQETHGITEARAARFGVPIVVALTVFKSLQEKAEIVMAHNLEFDRAMITSELDRANASGLWWQRRASAFRCTMEAATPVLQMPGQFGFKYPSLEETHRFLFPELDFTTKHDAEADLDATARVYRALEARGAWPAINHPSMIGR